MNFAEADCRRACDKLYIHDIKILQIKKELYSQRSIGPLESRVNHGYITFALEFSKVYFLQPSLFYFICTKFQCFIKNIYLNLSNADLFPSVSGLIIRLNRLVNTVPDLVLHGDFIECLFILVLKTIKSSGGQI